MSLFLALFEYFLIYDPMAINNHIPTVQIYGEQAESLTPDLLHCEPLITRSRAHEFRIKAHRHPGLTQLFYLKHGTGQAHLDGESTTLKSPCLIVISEMSVHGFIWSEDVEGLVMSISNPILARVGKVLAKERLVISSTLIMTVRKNQMELENILQLLSCEYSHTQDESRVHSLLSLVQLLGIWIERNAPSGINAASQTDRRIEYLKRYSQLINRDFVENKRVEYFANELGITASYLNNLCQQLVNKNALQLIHARIALEAKRHLIYTVQSISQIAYGLGFNDPAYFTRFFKRMTGESPKAFRDSASGGK